MILLDAMFDGLKEFLEEAGWSVKTVSDFGAKNAKDKKVREFARENDMILITADRKSASIAEASEVKNILVSMAEISIIVKRELNSKYPELVPSS